MGTELDRQKRALAIINDFCLSLEQAQGRILDQCDLNYPKRIIVAAFEERIRHIELLGEKADAEQHHELEQLRALRYRVSDFQIIDKEDRKWVKLANQGDLSEREILLLFMKYHQRGMREIGEAIDGPLEPPDQSITFEELRTRFLFR